MLWLPQEISFQECLLLLVDILLSYIYNLIAKKCVPGYMFTLRSSLWSFPNHFLISFLLDHFVLLLIQLLSELSIPMAALNHGGDISAVYLSLTIWFSIYTNIRALSGNEDAFSRALVPWRTSPLKLFSLSVAPNLLILPPFQCPSLLHVLIWPLFQLRFLSP